MLVFEGREGAPKHCQRVFFPAVISFHLAGGFQVSSPFQNFISLFEDVC